MALAIGSPSVISVGANNASLLAPAATGGSGAVAYQWYRDVDDTFTPGSANQIDGATALALSDSGLTPGTKYFYKIVATDAAMATASSAAVQVVTTASSPNPNQFGLSPFLGMLDQRFNGDTMSVQFDPDGTGALVGGQAVKFSVASTQGSSLANAGNGPILVEPATASDDDVCGFVNYDIKSAQFLPGDALEISLFGNVMYLYATEAIERGQRVFSLPFEEQGGCNGGVAPVTGSSSNPIVGYALDTSAQGQLMRVYLQTPSNSLDA